MLPLTLLKTAENHPMLTELKNGDTYNGRLVSCNVFMNICLRDVICTSRDGDRFWKLPECYIRGNSIKYLRIPDEVIDLVSEEEQKDRKFEHLVLRHVSWGCVCVCVCVCCERGTILHLSCENDEKRKILICC